MANIRFRLRTCENNLCSPPRSELIKPLHSTSSLVLVERAKSPTARNRFFAYLNDTTTKTLSNQFFGAMPFLESLKFNKRYLREVLKLRPEASHHLSCSCCIYLKFIIAILLRHTLCPSHHNSSVLLLAQGFLFPDNTAHLWLGPNRALDKELFKNTTIHTLQSKKSSMVKLSSPRRISPLIRSFGHEDKFTDLQKDTVAPSQYRADEQHINITVSSLHIFAISSAMSSRAITPIVPSFGPKLAQRTAQYINALTNRGRLPFLGGHAKVVP